MELKTILTAVAKTSFIVTSRVIVLSFLGILLNWCFLGFWAIPRILFKPELQIFALLIPLLIVVFGIAFPIWYFRLAKRFAFKKAVAAVFLDNSAELFSYFAEKVLATQYIGSGANATLNFSKSAIKKLHNFPPSLRGVFLFIIEQIPFAEAFLEIIEKMEVQKTDNSIDANQVGSQLSSKLKVNLSSVTFKPSLQDYWLSFSGNIALIALLIWLL